MAMLIFFSVVFLVYFFVNYYIYKHISSALSLESQIFRLLKALLIVVILSYPIGRIVERIYSSFLTDFIIKVGSVWLAAMLYLTLLFILLDFGRLVFLILSKLNITQGSFIVNFVKYYKIFAAVATVLLLTYGYFNALYPRVSKHSLLLNKSLANRSQLRIVAASDIHLGTVISNGRLLRFVELVNSQKPDIILLAGDIFDEDLGPVIKNDMGKLLSKLEAPLGVVAVTGNHEYIGGVTKAVQYLKDHGIHVLQDSVVVVDGILNIIGRDDRQSKVMGGKVRAELASLISSVDKNLVSILLDHQPYNLEEAERNGVDVQISGHTHHGQLWPLNYVTKSIFEVSRGYKKKGDSHIFVSTGFGTWGPPIRVGNRPEIIVVDIKSN
ncbi:MAG TPA: metallophosphoesterase [Tenuifilaceae bacterium]|nr:metallophosphoesterase [Tenuifilaceae bacterium]HPE18991.1 metallophosphoesterase [Tenuifilaceae bacterium]HPJ44624.1 metallophosphoesterase [Tenuifilaceae bacterium]HPQ33974.1 metallophosphoesterase [Tenuifilaceae bacterium]HRX69294.1 metallophosphoesterase [Tenuifilaceae bacterium]